MAVHSATDPVKTFLQSVREVRKTGQATQEQSYYPAVFTLLDEVGARSSVAKRALAHPSGVGGTGRVFPDVSLYEDHSKMLVLPVEVKQAGYSMGRLMGSAQALKYARDHGGGRVLLTNLRTWLLARLDDTGTTLEEVSRVDLVPDDASLDIASPDTTGKTPALLGMLEDGCQVRGACKSPELVAHMLAHHAGNMRDAINAAGRPGDLLAGIRDALSRGLQIDLTEDTLTPTVVQTLVYGTFAAWLSVPDPTRFRWMHSAYRLNVPVFAEIMHGALSPTLLRRCDLQPHLDAIERVLAWSDRDEFVAAFDGAAIQYFYEPFLAEFDPDLRKLLGIWYTPAAVADYQVARADHHVRFDLGIPDGIADDRVYLLDPACGTGTYLLAALNAVYQFHLDNGEPGTVAAARSLDAMTTRFLGFEILPAAFIICHLHLARHLSQLGSPPGEGDRMRVYLTNALTGWDEKAAPEAMTLFPELETELRDAAVAKHTDPVIVVLGNPPYQGYSSAETEEENRMMRPWSQELTTRWRLRKHRLNDLYVRFWRVAIARIIEITGRGVVCFITNRRWLGGRSYPSMRAALVDNFDDLWVDDLHGNVHDRSHPGDQSIFSTATNVGIRVGAAIVTAVRGEASPNGMAVVHLAEYRGSADDKRSALLARRDQGTMGEGYAPVSVSERSRYRFVSDTDGDYAALDEYLPFFISGVQPVGESLVDAEKATLEARMQDYLDPDIELSDLLSEHPQFTGKIRKSEVRRRALTTHRFDAARLVRHLFRPFDTRWLYWETGTGLLNRDRPALAPYWRNPAGGRQVSLVAPQTRRRISAARTYATEAIAGFNALDPDARVFPLYPPQSRYEGEDAGQLGLADTDRTVPTMVAPEWVAAAQQALGGAADEQTAGETVFYALIGITHSPQWLTTQPVDGDDFVTVPLPADPAALRAAANAGRQLAALLDPDCEVPGVTKGNIHPNLRQLAVPDSTQNTVQIETGRAGVSAGRREGDAVLWSATAGWRGVPDDVWEYELGGFRVLPKWLSYRMTALTSADREKFRILCRRVQAILDMSRECDSAYGEAVRRPLVTSLEDLPEVDGGASG